MEYERGTIIDLVIEMGTSASSELNVLEVTRSSPGQVVTDAIVGTGEADRTERRKLLRPRQFTKTTSHSVVDAHPVGLGIPAMYKGMASGVVFDRRRAMKFRGAATVTSVIERQKTESRRTVTTETEADPCPVGKTRVWTKDRHLKAY